MAPSLGSMSVHTKGMTMASTMVMNRLCVLKMVWLRETRPIWLSRKWPGVLMSRGMEAERPPWVMMIPEKPAATMTRMSTVGWALATSRARKAAAMRPRPQFR